MTDTEIKKGLAGVIVDYTAISKVNPETNSLLYRGYPVQELAATQPFEAVAYLLWHGELPSEVVVCWGHLGAPAVRVGHRVNLLFVGPATDSAGYEERMGTMGAQEGTGMEVFETRLPGVGTRYEFSTVEGDRLAVVARRDSRRDLVLYDQDDPDTCRAVVELNSEEAAVLVDLLGGSKVTQRLADLRFEVEGLAIEWVTMPSQGGLTGATIGEGAIRSRSGASVVAVIREGASILGPGPDRGGPRAPLPGSLFLFPSHWRPPAAACNPRAMTNQNTPARPIRGLLFDKDGTLFDFHETWSQWAQRFIADITGGDAARSARLAAVLGYDIDASRFERTSPMIAGTMEVVVDAVRTVLPEVGETALRGLIRESTAAAPQAEAVPLIPLFERLTDAGLVLGVATNDGEVPARAHLTRAGILDSFAFVAGYDSGFGANPSPGMCLGFARAVALEPGECVMIGDSGHDLVSGRAAGMRTVAVLTGLALRDELAPLADAVLESIGDLPLWLDGQA